VLNLTAGVLAVTNRIAIKGNPTKLILNKAQTKPYVAVANADALVIIDTSFNTDRLGISSGPLSKNPGCPFLNLEFTGRTAGSLYN
jgi:hypothetical protein